MIISSMLSERNPSRSRVTYVYPMLLNLFTIVLLNGDSRTFLKSSVLNSISAVSPQCRTRAFLNPRPCKIFSALSIILRGFILNVFTTGKIHDVEAVMPAFQHLCFSLFVYHATPHNSYLFSRKYCPLLKRSICQFVF